MNRGFLHGIIKALIFYGVGSLIALLTYLFIDSGYAHAPGLSLLIILLMLVIGLRWLVISIKKLFKNPKDRYQLGNLIIHICALLIAISFIVYKIQEDANDTRIRSEERSYNQNIITVTSFGDTVEASISGNVLYYKIKDSVYFNFLDSTRIAEFEIREIKKY